MKLLFLLIFIAACGKVPDQVTSELVQACQKHVKSQDQLLDLKAVATKVVSGKVTEIGVVKSALYTYEQLLWPKGKEVKVCWQNADPKSEEAILVKETVDNTWNNLFDSYVAPGAGVRFTGWQACDGNPSEIRIIVRDERPHTSGLGVQLSYYPESMVLNFSFQKWNDYCRAPESNRKYCISVVAVHEFGHALGLDHEQVRTDKPADCEEVEAPYDIAATQIGPWDNYSVMNYCAVEWNSRGVLSVHDMSGIRYLYAPVVDKEFCQQVVDTWDEQKAVFSWTQKVGLGIYNFFGQLFFDIGN